MNAPCTLRDILVNLGGPEEDYKRFSAKFGNFWPITTYFEENIPLESAFI